MATHPPFPAGCRIYFCVGEPQIIDDVLDARSYRVGSSRELILFDAKDVMIRIINFDHVVAIAPLATVGPANADH